MQTRISVLVAISPPTVLAVRAATAAGFTLVGVTRGDWIEIYSRPDRIA